MPFHVSLFLHATLAFYDLMLHALLWHRSGVIWQVFFFLLQDSHSSLAALETLRKSALKKKNRQQQQQADLVVKANDEALQMVSIALGLVVLLLSQLLGGSDTCLFWSALSLALVVLAWLGLAWLGLAWLGLAHNEPDGT